MLAHLETAAARRPGLRQILADFGPAYFANGLIGFIFSATGPVAIILSVGTRGDLSQTELASWIFPSTSPACWCCCLVKSLMSALPMSSEESVTGPP